MSPWRLLLGVWGAAALVLVGCAAESGQPPSPTTTPTSDATAAPAPEPLVCLPKGGTDRPILLLVHGGSFETGSPADLTWLCEEGAARGYATFSLGYRLLPATYPAQLEDLTAAVERLRSPSQVERFGTDPDDVSIIGSSAGAILASQLLAGVEGSPLPVDTFRAGVLLSGGYDFQPTGEPDVVDTIVRSYLGCAATGACAPAADASPIDHVSAADAPMLLINAAEEFVPAQDARDLAAALQDAGVPRELRIVAGADHADQIIRERTTLRDEMWAFLDRYR